MRTIKSVLADKDTVVIERSATVMEAARLMSQRHIGGLPVVEGDRLAGIFTERDIMARVVAKGLDASATPVSDVMSTELVVADLDDACESCLRKMQQARVRHLIVLRGGRLAGIVSLRDLLAVELDERDEAITLLNAYLHYIPADMSTTRTRT